MFKSGFNLLMNKASLIFLLYLLEYPLEKEMSHLKKVFLEYNNFPRKLIESTIERESNKFHAPDESQDVVEENADENVDEITLSLPYAGIKGEQIRESLFTF